MKLSIKIAALLLLAVSCSAPKSNSELSALIDRVGGQGASERIIATVNPKLAKSADEDVFVISKKAGRPFIEGSSLSAASTGIGWYLNHYAGINLSWNNLTTDLTAVDLPLPAKAERRSTTAQMRYYLNYCTFSYTMAFWNWERWEKEIDWMALRGINMPLMIVGMECVWSNILTELGYSKDEINEYVAGPGFQAWWMMNNLQGWGGPNPDWWYEREAQLSKKMLDRMRALGMEPVLPGYGGMMPSDVDERFGYEIINQGKWCGFERPTFQLPTSDTFAPTAELYYRHLDAVMGKAKYYSMDPFHEGRIPKGTDLAKCYKLIDDAMLASEPGAKWVIQSWQGNPCDEALAGVPHGDFVVLDLFSDGNPHWMDNHYQGHDWLFCMLHNFGGRTGIHGRLDSMMTQYFDALEKEPGTLKGVGVTPEGSETNPILYDAIMELPWLDKSECSTWLENWVKARYGVESESLLKGWQKIASSALACPTAQQGTSEPIVCARPELEVKRVSSWSTSALYYDPADLQAALEFFEAGADAVTSEVGCANYHYDYADLKRQVLSDACIPLLAEVKKAFENKDMKEYERLYNKFLDTILEIDDLLSTEPEMTYSYHKEMAESICDEVSGTTDADRAWMVWNLRTQITTWGHEEAATSGLRDYSNREWSGMLRNYCYPRWKRFFECLRDGKKTPDAHDWYQMEISLPLD